MQEHVIGLATVTEIAALLSVAAFVLALVIIVMDRWAAASTSKAFATSAAPVAENRSITAGDAAKVLEAGAKVVDSLGKAGPSLTLVAASVVFAWIAAWSGRPPAAGPEPRTATSASQPNAQR